jgi:hypothetical protein
MIIFQTTKHDHEIFSKIKEILDDRICTTYEKDGLTIHYKKPVRRVIIIDNIIDELKKYDDIQILN